MTILISIFLLVFSCCNIGIWWKFQQRNNAPMSAIHQQNRARQARRLTKTLLVVSAAAVFSWLPHAIILNMTAAHMVSVPIIFFHCFYILTYSSSFVNPIIYALKISEFRQSLVALRSRRRAVDRMDREVKKDGQDTVTSGALAREARLGSREDMPVAFDFSHQGHALITLFVQFLCSDWSKFDR